MSVNNAVLKIVIYALMMDNLVRNVKNFQFNYIIIIMKNNVLFAKKISFIIRQICNAKVVMQLYLFACSVVIIRLTL